MYLIYYENNEQNAIGFELYEEKPTIAPSDEGQTAKIYYLNPGEYRAEWEYIKKVLPKEEVDEEEPEPDRITSSYVWKQLCAVDSRLYVAENDLIPQGGWRMKIKPTVPLNFDDREKILTVLKSMCYDWGIGINSAIFYFPHLEVLIDWRV